MIKYPKGQGCGLPKDICTKCFRCFQWVKSKNQLCFWCEHPEPKVERLPPPKPTQKMGGKPSKGYNFNQKEVG